MSEENSIEEISMNELFYNNEDIVVDENIGEYDNIEEDNNIEEDDDIGGIETFDMKIIREFHNQIDNNNYKFNLFFQILGMGCFTKFIIYNFNFLVWLFFGISCSYGGFMISYFSTKSFFMFYKFLQEKIQQDETEKEEEEKEEDFQEKYNLFLIKNKDKLKEILENNIVKENEYTINLEDDLKKLKDIQNHQRYDLPFQYNKELIIFYDFESKTFHYYTKNSNIQYEVLNSICRSYVLDNKCVNLFQDQKELIEMIGEEYEKEEEEEEKNEKEEEEENEKEEPVNNFINIFYKKKTRVDVEKEKQKKNLEKNKKEKTINKFIYKGNMEDYKYLFLKKDINTINNLSYEDYKKQQLELEQLQLESDL